ncbi:MAG: iron-sulfur cluster assembly accessory protein [Gemmatimonadota bacterium]|nr:iron-sulfur cluster assembly accessory protein [Gemmatimonadota bacterium]
MITITDAAAEKIRLALERAEPPRRHLRISVSSSGSEFGYRLDALTAEDVDPGDRELEQDGFVLVLDQESAERLEGATVDYRESLVENGFRIDNPNEPASPELPTGARDDLEGPVPDRVRTLLDSEINPSIAAHGGHVRMVDYEEGTVFLAFGGGCHGCGMVDVTLKQGIESRIREVVPEVVEVVDTTDHSTGENPYI